MLHATLPVLFESTDNAAVVADPVNADWVALVRAVGGRRYEMLARRYYEALYHFRSQPSRPPVPGTIDVAADNQQQALEGMLGVIEQRKARRREATDAGDAPDIFVNAQPDASDETLPPSLRDLSHPPRPLDIIVGGPGRPPCDALCLLRAFVAAPLLGVADNPTAVHRLLHSNPTYAHLCGFLGRDVLKQPGELTSRRLPSLAVCEEFSEVMTRYGLWQLARLEQVGENIASGAVAVEDTMAFDTTHIIANSHCGNVVPPDSKAAADGKRPKHRKVPRMTKACACGRENWQNCEHPWTPTDHGAAVVVKGHSRIYWAHKASIVAFGDSEIPTDARVLNYAADGDGKTLLPHIRCLQADLPQTLQRLQHIVADDPYRENCDAVPLTIEGVRLIVPVHPRRVAASLAASLPGIDHFTPTGVPICDGGHRFELRGRDLGDERYIWAAPDDSDGQSVCASCPLSIACTKAARRNIRVDRSDLPQINWDHPQHFARNRARYSKRTAVERAIKRLKIDLLGEHLTHRDAIRVQAHLDRKLLALHLLLAVKSQT